MDAKPKTKPFSATQFSVELPRFLFKMFHLERDHAVSKVVQCE